eukprot:Polyplicarium_translucidae@DN2400_c0_g1_i3.p2
MLSQCMHASIQQLVCVHGYSLIALLPTAVLMIIPSNAVKWLILVLGLVWSAAFMLIELYRLGTGCCMIPLSGVQVLLGGRAAEGQDPRSGVASHDARPHWGGAEAVLLQHRRHGGGSRAAARPLSPHTLRRSLFDAPGSRSVRAVAVLTG